MKVNKLFFLSVSALTPTHLFFRAVLARNFAKV